MQCKDLPSWRKLTVLSGNINNINTLFFVGLSLGTTLLLLVFDSLVICHQYNSPTDSSSSATPELEFGIHFGPVPLLLGAGAG